MSRRSGKESILSRAEEGGRPLSLAERLLEERKWLLTTRDIVESCIASDALARNLADLATPGRTHALRSASKAISQSADRLAAMAAEQGATSDPENLPAQ